MFSRVLGAGIPVEELRFSLGSTCILCILPSCLFNLCAGVRVRHL
ncbi:hypothetical protein COLINT_02471 [Collinsella intestinalis DSM 13280]|uniref:Uncharacterized protein n=1 Tax=Collinsella intestinalis DSM 13280 TaxID=521003 RepID=C4F8U5_9ACTN|nr:hypothetical protein COLINT_02471 [Collinsella intestinalis DSM 13280]